MGYLYYGSEPQPAEIPDRVLAHVKVVMTTKLRRGESFTLTWTHPCGHPAGRTSLWIQPAIPLRFVFESPEAEKLDSDYLQDLARSANSSGGLTIEWSDAHLDRPAPEPLRAVATAA
ncbi:DUF7882 family protein [Microbacterium hominis]|uniref:DUF7882 domain-containing protein n=1 Tax=Microbacterium hominis TaxID=162426 RepID=A0A7D4TPW0_9MICO|nr:hypothetical protein [Microbacterium hominis]QKJ18604.1 hypothetical protein HQM25_03865 [Microbacterium hominis]